MRLESVLHVPRLDIALPPRYWQEPRFLAFCGIGNPDAFFGDLRSWGFQVVQHRSFPDHHVYSAPEATQMEAAAVSCSADALLCTEKDVWNLRNVQFTALPVYCCRISFELPESFWTAVGDIALRGKAVEAR
jgi:tetraacyldisaccharide-1-P 4'-kinase